MDASDVDVVVVDMSSMTEGVDMNAEVNLSHIRGIGFIMHWAYQHSIHVPMLQILDGLLSDAPSREHKVTASVLALMLGYPTEQVVRFKCCFSSCDITTWLAERLTCCIRTFGSVTLPFEDGPSRLALELLTANAPLELHFTDGRSVHRDGVLNEDACQQLCRYLNTELSQQYLQVLDLSDNHIGLDGAEAISGSFHCVLIWLTNPFLVPDFLSRCSHECKLTSVMLRRTLRKSSIEGATLIAKSLSSNRSITFLDMSSNGLGDSVCR